MKDIVIVIPAYNPSKKLIELVDSLILLNFSKIIIVNDGSIKGKSIFRTVKEKPECLILEYKENKGKGYALKYAINYYLENLKNNYKGIVSVDADYQHLPNDVLNIALRLLGNQDSLILGIRDFYEKGVPTPNRFGNRLTSFIFKLLYGKNIKDTQTGLRGIPNRYLNLCLESSGKRFEFEMNMLIKFVKQKINILEIPIETVYYKRGESKFNKWIDSILIYKVIFTEYIKFLLSSLICSFLDIILFTVFLNIFSNLNNNLKIILGTFISRIIADFFNFNINKNFVFISHENSKKIFCKYYLLSFSKMLLSASLVLIFHNLFNNCSETVLKIIVDVFIYLISYKIQKKYIFKT